MVQPWAQKQKKKKVNLLTFGRPQAGRDLQQNALSSPCQPLNEVWEGVDPPPLPVIQLHYMHLCSPGLALPFHQVFNHCSGRDSAFLLQGPTLKVTAARKVSLLGENLMAVADLSKVTASPCVQALGFLD